LHWSTGWLFCEALADAMCINQTIAELYLGDNQNGDQGIKAP